MYIEIQRFVQEEFEKRTIPVSSNFQYRKIRENLIPPSLCLPRAEEDSRLFERGTSARSCIQIGVLVTRTIFHENISGGGGGGGRSRRSLRGFPRFSSSDRPPPASQYFSNFLSRSYGTRSIMTSREQSFRPSCSLFALQHPYNRAHRFPASLLLPPSFCLLLSTFPFSLSLSRSDSS